MSRPPLNRARLAAILGPTNTGKTHYAIERMLGRTTGVIGLPLRLLAREVYDKVVAAKGANQVALMTGEEKIVPKFARYYICTVEAMPEALPSGEPFAFAAIDEVQLVDHPERGHVFTERVMHMRGTEETLLLGAETARSILRHLVGEVMDERIVFETRERFSELSHIGALRLSRLPKRSVIVAFSASEVYALAELIRRYRGGAAVVMGRLSPRTRNSQAELYQSGEVDFLVATDAVGMGLNLDCDHIAFASLRKFDGHRKRYLRPMEAGQIAGRAGRFRNNGTFGTTADAPPMDEAMVNAIVNHHFEPIHRAEWRNSDLDFDTLEALRESLHARSPSRRLKRVRPASDELSLERLATLPEVLDDLRGPDDVARLWELCQLPDFRGLTIDAHVRMLSEIHAQMSAHRGRIPHEFLERRVSRLDDTTGGVDVLQGRLAQIRTWTYCANKPRWMFDAGHWQKRARAVEDRLSDALHESLIARFVDRRTSALLKGIGAQMTASVKDDGQVWVDDHLIGQLEGLDFQLDASGSEAEAKALQAAAAKAIGPEIDRRLTSLSGAAHNVFTLDDAGRVRWGGKAVGRIGKGGTVFNPEVVLIGGEYGNEGLQRMAAERLRQWLQAEAEDKLAPLRALKGVADSPDTLPPARGFAFEMMEGNGNLSRAAHARTIRSLEREARAQLWAVGTVFGQYDIFLRDMVKPKPARLLGQLVSFGAGGDKKPFVPFAGMTSIPDPDGEIARSHSTDAIRRAGYRVCGPRIVRFDILERLARMIRQAQAQDTSKGPQAFQVMQEMLALLGSTYEEARGVLASLGYVAEEREVVKAEVVKAEGVKGEATVADAVGPEGSGTVKTTPVETPEPVTPETPQEEHENEKAVDAVASAPKPTTKATTAEAATAEAATAEDSAPQAAADTPASKARKGATPNALHVYHHRETLEDGSHVQHDNTEFWVWGRTPHNARRNKNAARGRGGRPPRGDRKMGGKPPNRGERKGGQKGGQKDYKPKREKTRVEDSPFAALKDLYKGGDS